MAAARKGSLKRDIVLASKSSARLQLLENAGLSLSSQPSGVDETPIKDLGKSQHKPLEDIALDLAKAKAAAIAGSKKQYVIGADQILGCDGILFDKPHNLEEAYITLNSLQGKTHSLYTTICIFKDGICDFTHVSKPSLTMRRLGTEEIRAYIACCGTSILSSVGAYQLEGPGVRLFTDIQGSYFDILGLPLLPLLEYLRTENEVNF